MMKKIVAIDAAEISPIMKYLGLDGLIAIAKRGGHFFTAMISGGLVSLDF
jgi:hypothetical protein